MGYRKDLENAVYESEEAAEYKFTYVTKIEAINVLDEVEARVNEIKDMIDPIEGLSEIDNIKKLLESLSKDLY